MFSGVVLVMFWSWWFRGGNASVVVFWWRWDFGSDLVGLFGRLPVCDVRAVVFLSALPAWVFWR